MTFVELFRDFKTEVSYISSLNISKFTKLMLSALKIVALSSYKSGQKSPAVARALNGSDSSLLPYDFGELQLESPGIRNVAVIPAYVRNEKERNQLFEAVFSVSRQVDAVLVVNDGSPFPLPQTLASNSHVINLNRNSGPAVARNVGLDACQRIGSVQNVLFLDADCVATESWARHMTSRLSQTAVVAGITKSLSNGKDYVSLYHDVFGTLNGRLLPGDQDNLLYAPTCNLGINLPLFLNSSKSSIYFDPSFPSAAFEDVEFSLRLRKANISIVFEPKAVMQHDYDVSWKGFANQFKKYGKSEGLFLSRHPEYHSLASDSKIISSPFLS